MFCFSLHEDLGILGFRGCEVWGLEGLKEEALFCPDLDLASMEGASEGENPTKNHENNNSNGKFNNSSEGQSKPKRQMKTPFQLETLEKAYACKFNLDFFFYFLF